MILDSSAVVAILLNEPEAEALLATLSTAGQVGIAAPTLVEAGIVLSHRLGTDARGLLARFVEEADVEVLSFDGGHAAEAVGAWLRYGKGRHPARLNYGDCIAYATAMLLDAPLLAIGNDFRQTDVRLA